MQVSIARQLSLQPTTVGNFFMNARRRLQDKWKEGDYDLDTYEDTTAGNSEEPESDTTTIQTNDYDEGNQMTLNRELLVPEILQHHLLQQQPSSQLETHQQGNLNINSIDEQHQQHHNPHGISNPSLLLSNSIQSNVCNDSIPVTLTQHVTDITNSSLNDQIVPINTHQENEQAISQMQKDSLTVIHGSENLECSNVPGQTTTTTAIDGNINNLNPNPHHSVYSLTSL